MARRRTISDLVGDNVARGRQYADQFKRTFGRSIGPYMDKFTGFDVLKFDDEVIQPPDGKSTEEVVRERYGEDAVTLIRNLIGASA